MLKDTDGWVEFTDEGISAPILLTINMLTIYACCILQQAYVVNSQTARNLSADRINLYIPDSGQADDWWRVR